MAGPESRGPAERLTREIRAAGNLGLTAAQLARVVGASRSEVEGALGELERRRLAVRVGHGLWIDPALRDEPALAPGFVGPESYLSEFTRAHRIEVAEFGGDVQFRPNTEEPVHRWWPYVQGFSAGLVRTAFRRCSIGPGATVLDPYAGSGTVLTTARSAGALGIGVELMPISAFVARAKQLWEVPPLELERRAARLVRSARRAAPSPRPFLRETSRHFDPGPLRSLRQLRACLEPSGDESDQLLRLAFARILVDSSRLRRSPCLGYGPKPRVAPAAPFELFERAAGRIVEDLRRLQGARSTWGPRAEVREEDSRGFSPAEGAVDLAVTSPPYANGMDYVMNYKLELAWLGFARSYEDLASLKQRMVACDNLPRAALALRGRLDVLEADEWLVRVLRQIRGQLGQKASYRRSDMDRVLEGYFADLWPTLRSVYRALRPGGRYVVVNGDSFLAGVYVPSDLIFARLGVAAGFEVEGLEVARTRRSGQRRDFRLRETVLTLRKPVAG